MDIRTSFIIVTVFVILVELALLVYGIKFTTFLEDGIRILSLMAIILVIYMCYFWFMLRIQMGGRQ